MATINWVAAPTFTRPANTTQYASGDLVANSTVAASVTPLRFSVPWSGNNYSCIVRGASVRKSDETDVTGASFDLHLYLSSPTVANGDNGALSTTYASKIGVVSVGALAAYTDDAYGISFSGNFYVDGDATGRFIYGLLEAKGTYTPASEETFTVTLIVEQ